MRLAWALLVSLYVGAAAPATPPQFPLSTGDYQFQVVDAEYEIQLEYWADVSIQGVYIKAVMTTCGGPFRCNEVFADSILWWHERSGQWITATSQEDYDVDEIGGCSGGSMTIDPDAKTISYC